MTLLFHLSGNDPIAGRRENESYVVMKILSSVVYVSVSENLVWDWYEDFSVRCSLAQFISIK